MKNEITLRTSYSEYRNQYRYTTFEIEDTVPEVGSSWYGWRCVDVSETSLDFSESSNEIATTYDYYIASYVDESDEDRTTERYIAVKTHITRYVVMPGSCKWDEEFDDLADAKAFLAEKVEQYMNGDDSEDEISICDRNYDSVAGHWRRE